MTVGIPLANLALVPRIFRFGEDESDVLRFIDFPPISLLGLISSWLMLRRLGDGVVMVLRDESVQNELEQILTRPANIRFYRRRFI